MSWTNPNLCTWSPGLGFSCFGTDCLSWSVIICRQRICRDHGYTAWWNNISVSIWVMMMSEYKHVVVVIDTCLQGLWLHGNLLTTVPSSLSKLTNLKQLSLSGNQLKQLPDMFSGMTQMDDFAAAGNQLTEVSFIKPRHVYGLAIWYMYAWVCEYHEILCTITVWSSMLTLPSSCMYFFACLVCLCSKSDIVVTSHHTVTTVKQHLHVLICTVKHT